MKQQRPHPPGLPDMRHMRAGRWSGWRRGVARVALAGALVLLVLAGYVTRRLHG